MQTRMYVGLATAATAGFAGSAMATDVDFSTLRVAGGGDAFDFVLPPTTGQSTKSFIQLDLYEQSATSRGLVMSPWLSLRPLAKPLNGAAMTCGTATTTQVTSPQSGTSPQVAHSATPSTLPPSTWQAMANGTLSVMNGYSASTGADSGPAP